MRRERKQMTVDDFLYVMKLNKGIYPEYDRLDDQAKRLIANVNICSGTAETLFDEDGNIFMVFGIRYIGLGEAWMACIPQRRTPALYRTAAEHFNRLRDTHNLWRIFAESKISENFIEHLGFKKADGMHIWTRI
jgi:hypothetical protein